MTTDSVLLSGTVLHVGCPPPPHHSGDVNKVPSGAHVSALVLSGAVAAVVFSNTAQHALFPLLPCVRLTSISVSFTLTMVGTSVGGAAEGRSTSCVAGFPGPQFPAESHISHSICTTPSPG